MKKDSVKRAEMICELISLLGIIYTAKVIAIILKNDIKPIDLYWYIITMKETKKTISYVVIK
jgi:hypothetical protein